MRLNVDKILDCAVVGAWILAISCLVWTIQGLDWSPISVAPKHVDAQGIHLP